jgi:nicotinate phosphoribosyltransferase
MHHVSPLLTDLYQINMIQAYLDLGDTDTAVFEMFVRSLPARRGFLLAAGLEQALDYLENLRFSADEIACLKSTGRFVSPAKSMPCRRARHFSSTSRCCASPRRCRRRSSSNPA